jgi:hypothetical protein
MASLAPHRLPGMRLSAYRASDEDIVRIRNLQAEGRAYRQSHPGQTRMTIRISADSCRLGSLPQGPLMTTTFVRPDVATGYLVFLRDVDVRKAAADVGTRLEEWVPACSIMDAPDAVPATSSQR